MRLLQVRFKNLNSLAGEWLIDFTHPAYSADGIFAITGPTGAGKSTILDAICLALYGQTPRLKNISKSSNEIFARQTGECFAEVSFETTQGRYRCHWSQHRARRKASGDLQTPKHEIVDALTDTVLENKLREVIKRVEQVTGMDFDRFTRSMLLAQGGFAAFLHADPDARSPLLEQITGTAIYSQISQKTHQRWSEENKKLESLQAELAGLRLLSAEEEQALRTQQQTLQQQETALSGQYEQARTVLDWWAEISRLEQQASALEQDWQAFEQQQLAFQPQRYILQRARQALRLDRHYDQLRNARQLRQREQEALAQAREQHRLAAAAAASALTARQAAEVNQQQAQQTLQQETGLIRQVQELDRELATLRQQQQTGQQQLADSEQQCRQLQERINTLQQQQQNCQTQLATAECYLAAHSADAGLVENLAGLQQRFERWRALQTRRGQLQHTLAISAEVVATSAAQYASCTTEVQQQRDRLLQMENQFDALGRQIDEVTDRRELAELRAEQERLQEQSRQCEALTVTLARIQVTAQALAELQQREQAMCSELDALASSIEQQRTSQRQLEHELEQQQEKLTLLHRIRALEDERKRLQDGVPCPLCGAPEHPYAAGNSPQPEQTEVELKKLKTALRTLGGQLERQQIRQAELTQERQQIQREKNAQAEQLALAEQDCQRLCHELDISPEQSAIESCQLSLQQRLQHSVESIRTAEQLAREQKELLTRISSQRQELDKANEKLHQLNRERERAAQAQQRAAEEAAELDQQLQALQHDLGQELALYGLSVPAFAALDTLQAELSQRRDEWRKQQAWQQEQEKQKSLLQVGLQAEQTRLEALHKDLEKYRQQHAVLAERLTVVTNNRTALYGDKDPAAEEQKLQNILETVRENLAQCQHDYQQRHHEAVHWQREIARLETSIRQLEQTLADLEPAFLTQLSDCGFKDEADYCAASLKHEQQQALEQQDEALRRRQTELETRRQDTRARLAQERAKALTEQPREQIHQTFERSAAELKEVQRQLGALQDRLAENSRQQALQRERLQALAAQRQECERWNRLEQLIGSYDGKKYRNFAQGLTFELMVVAANRQLQKMSDRYLLIRDRAQPLELNVIDQYQGGEVRSTKNLSGGESFVVSLALALGLAQMASRNVRVDSLFLDEGFGTLDQDALETALDTLAGLRQDGKLIGVISHVAELKERIGTQIQVIPLPGGRSRLSGPGCQAVGSSTTS